MQKPVVDHRDAVNLLRRDSAFERREHHEQPLVVAVVQQRADFLRRLIVQLRQAQAVQRNLRAAHRL
ncbi:hypothetical protein SDC9_63870 [bioreactor metagenome]|uniref:Uncharacterized protein n=1 Tax=bioreactor metagenome TaxID=1076179 RepID=A0A644XMV4_9ZZZZ